MPDLLTIRPDARAEWSALVAGLDLLEAAGRVTPCQADPDPFGSEDRAERAEAAESCAGCPLLVACAAFAEANRETSMVWAGRDRTASPTTARRRRVSAE